LVGDTLTGAGNVIAFNTFDGIVTSSTANGNRILSNSIFSNQQLGVDLENNGVTLNDLGDGDDGGNRRQNFPVLTSSSSGVISGTFNSTASSSFRLEFFANTTADPSGNGEGEMFLGATNVTTDGSGNASFTFNYTPITGKARISSTATNLTTNDTSEFSRTITEALSSGTVSFTTATSSGNEDNSGAAVNQTIATIQRTGGSNGAISVPVQLATSPGTSTAGTDYTNIFPITVNFGDGDSTSKTVSLPIIGDTTVEPNETINLVLGTVTGGATLGTQTTATYTILNDDVAPAVPIITIAATDANAGEGTPANPGTFTISRTGATTSALTVNYTLAGTASSTDYTPALLGTATIDAGSTSTTITTNPVDDTLVEGSETVILNLIDTANYDLGASNSATITITDNDIATGNRQIITPSPTPKTVAPGTATSFDVNYSTNPVSTPTTGLGLRMFWNSNQVTFNNITNLLTNGAQPTGAMELDTGDLDNDPLTNMRLTQAWVDLNTAFPSANPVPSTRLFTANFTAASGFTGTNVRFGSVSTAAGFTFTSTPEELAPPPLVNHDIDGNGSVDALTDGILAIRFLFGLTGTALTNGAVGAGATRTSGTDIVNYLTPARSTMLDVDGNGSADALTDGILAIRYMFGLSGSALINGAVGAGATRTSAADISTFLNGYRP
jgi:hypothetical protein